MQPLTADRGDPEPTSTFHRHCFACGTENPDGLRIRFMTHGTSSSGTVTIDRRFQGYDSIAQGGIVATVLDTAMVQLLRDLFGGNPMTARLDVRYFHDTPPQESLNVTTRLSQCRANTYWMESQILFGAIRCASAQGVFRIHQTREVRNQPEQR
jgi:acyl-coenzyme A thioesterase PaaI-like protein